jgi:hypothetical protein
MSPYQEVRPCLACCGCALITPCASAPPQRRLCLRKCARPPLLCHPLASTAPSTRSTLRPPPQALYNLVKRNFAARDDEADSGGGGGGGGGGGAVVKGLGISVNNTLMELRSICNHPFIRCEGGTGAARRRQSARLPASAAAMGCWWVACASLPPWHPSHRLRPSTPLPSPTPSRLHPEMAETALPPGPLGLPPGVRLSSKLEMLDRVLLRMATGQHKVGAGGCSSPAAARGRQCERSRLPCHASWRSARAAWTGPPLTPNPTPA